MSLVLGLEVTPRAVRGAFLRTSLRGFEMERYAETALPGSNGGEPSHDAIQAAIREVIGRSERPPDRVNVSLDGQSASLRFLEIPAGVEKKAGEVLPGLLESVLPFEIEDAVVDYQVVGRGDTDVQVMAVAVPRDIVAKELRHFQSLGINPRELAVGASAFDGLGPLLPEAMRDRTLLIVDVGHESTDFCILSNGECGFARTVSGGMNLVESGRREQLGGALQRTLASYRAQRGEEPELVLLSGEAAPMESAQQWLSTQLGLECGVVPLPSAIGADDDDTLPKFGRAAALAARALIRKKRLDLRRGEFASKAAAGQIRKNMRLLGICAAAVMLAFGVSLFSRYRVAKAEHDNLVDRLAQVSGDLLGEETRSALHARDLLLGGPRESDPLPRFDAYDVLEAVSESIPAEIQHDTRRLLIEIDDSGEDGRLEIQGTVGSIAERDRIVDELRSHRCFSQVEKGSISSAAEDRKDYKLVVSIDCEEGSPSAAEKEN